MVEVVSLFEVGPVTVHFFGVMIAVGVLVSMMFFLKEIKRAGYDNDLVLNGVFFAFFGGIVGARLVFVFVYEPAYYIQAPLEILFIHQGGLSIHGGIVGGLVTAVLYMKKNKLPIWRLLDLAAPFLILAQGISRIGCDVFGYTVPEWWPLGIDHNGEQVHPVQAYEFTLNYLLFGYLWVKLRAIQYEGQVFLHYLFGFMLIRAIVELARLNPEFMGISVSHLMSLIGMTVAVILILWKRKPHSVSIQKEDVSQAGWIVGGLIILSWALYWFVQG